MALVEEFGRLDLFITMICIPNWVEIKEELRPGKLPQERPDLVTRVFRHKLQYLDYNIFKKEIFGPIATHVLVVEFHKRGLPHIHLLLLFKEEDTINR